LRRIAKITGQTLHLYGSFDGELAARILEIPESERLEIKTIDLSDVDSIFADGALPIVADYMRHGKQLRVRCEAGSHVTRSLELHGWSKLFSEARVDADARIPQRVRHFRTMEAIDALVSSSVRGAMQRIKCATDVLKSFEWSLSEVLGNVCTHSESTIGGLAQTLVMPVSSMIAFSAVDAGIGLRNSLSGRYRNIQDDMDAIRLAIRKGVTRDTEAGQGWGLFGTSRIASASGGHLSIWTGTGKMVIDQNGNASFFATPFFHGTAINLILHTDRPLSLQTALEAVYDTPSIVFNDYEGVRGLTSLRLTDHASAFSNRATGKKLRNIVLNLLAQPDNEVCVIDFANVRVVASSFADEFLGKTALSLGNLFEARVRINNISEDNQRIVSTAIATRLASSNKNR
jgi:anti-anti-sigma regulatory factor/anti-sigma regulatory factor (Ser/Thr protein kinase)